MAGKTPKIEELKTEKIRPNKKTSDSTDAPISDEARRIHASALAKSLGTTREAFLKDLRKASRRTE